MATIRKQTHTQTSKLEGWKRQREMETTGSGGQRWVWWPEIGLTQIPLGTKELPFSVSLVETHRVTCKMLCPLLSLCVG